jgi:PAS domain S-box-containing protein
LKKYLYPLGYSTEEMMGRHLFEFMEHEHIKTATRNLQRRDSGISENHDFIFRKKNGDPLIVLLTTNPVIENGRKTGSVAMAKVKNFYFLVTVTRISRIAIKWNKK